MPTLDPRRLSAKRALDLYGEPVLIVARDGLILHKNSAASAEFGSAALIDTSLHELAADADAVNEFLRSCASSASWVPAAFSVVIGERVADWKPRGCLIAPASDGEAALLAVRLIRQDEAWARFRSLTAEVRQLRELSRIRHNELIEQRKRETQLLQSQKLESIGLLASGISHDFNNLLTAIRGYVELARIKAAEDPDILRYLTLIEDGTQRATSLTAQLLAYSGRGHFVVEPVHLSDEIRACADLLHVSISGGTSLSLELDDTLPNCLMDKTQLQQVLMNLVINASEATDAHHGAITVSTFSADLDKAHFDVLHFQGDMRPGRFACLEISDNGSGMDDVTLSRVFDPFFSTKDGGHGLGLAAVLGIIKAHDGGIAIDTAPDRGTTIRVLLPTTTKASRTSSIDTDETVALKDGTVLVIDDESSVRDIATELVESLGMHCVTASGGADGVDLFKGNPQAFDVVLLDMNMPGMDGIETLEHLIEVDPDVRAILSSGYSEQIAIDADREQRAAGFLKKPYGLKALAHIITKTLTG